MRITGYGITLERLTEDRIELLRNWRNAEDISRYMEYQQHITPEMQQQWFNGLRELNDFYFIVAYNDEPLGLIHTSHIDWSTGIGHAGLFIFDERYLASPIPVLASVSMLDALFGLFPLHAVYAKVKQDNSVAADYNKKLGFRLQAGEEGKPFQQYLLVKELYYMSAAFIRRSARMLGKKGLMVELTQHEMHHLQDKDLIQKAATGITLQVKKV